MSNSSVKPIETPGTEVVDGDVRAQRHLDVEGSAVEVATIAASDDRRAHCPMPRHKFSTQRTIRAPRIYLRGCWALNPTDQGQNRSSPWVRGTRLPSHVRGPFRQLSGRPLPVQGGVLAVDTRASPLFEGTHALNALCSLRPGRQRAAAERVNVDSVRPEIWVERQSINRTDTTAMWHALTGTMDHPSSMGP